MTVVRAPGVQADGVIGARGWRAHCPGCGLLGPVKSYRAAEDELRTHTKACRPGAADGGEKTAADANPLRGSREQRRAGETTTRRAAA